jgi:hypothetical protein
MPILRASPSTESSMRRTAIALLTVTALLAACGERAAAPAATEAPAAADAPPPEMPADAPPQEEVAPEAGTAAAVPCADALGAEAAGRLVERCRAVSPATHPPCNTANPCVLIQDEIDRACALVPAGEPRPAECAA